MTLWRAATYAVNVRFRVLGAALLSVVTSPLVPRSATADPLRWHAEAGLAHALGDPQAHEYGFGTEGSIAAEWALIRPIGPQIEVGGLWLPHTNPPLDKTLADHGDGTAVSVLLGVRARPFTDVAGPWADVNLGYVLTGGLSRFGFDAHVGYDWRLGTWRWDVGPYVGYFHVIQPPDALRPEDAHVLSVGVHVALGAERSARPAPPPPAPPPPPPAPPPAAPPAPPPDRDGDGIPDALDMCPDVPGVQTDNPQTNGCPTAGDQVHVVKDRIEYDDVILFDTDQAHVHHASWTILRKLATYIVAHPDIEVLDITGHADERGAEDYNMRLSQARAGAVKDLLVRFGVDAKRITTIGYGEGRPRAQGHTESEWRQNRRVEFIITQVKNAQGGSTSLTPEPKGDAP